VLYIYVRHAAVLEKRLRISHPITMSGFGRNSKRDIKKTGGKPPTEDIPAADIPAPSSILTPETPAGGQVLRSSRRIAKRGSPAETPSYKSSNNFEEKRTKRKVKVEERKRLREDEAEMKEAKSRDASMMSFDELSAVSKDMNSISCDSGFNFNTSIVDTSALIFPHLEEVEVKSFNFFDLQFIATVLENSIPQGRGFLKNLLLRQTPRPGISYVDYGKLSASLIKVIEVRISTFNKKASPGLKHLQLSFSFRNESLQLESCLDAIFRLDQIITLSLNWVPFSVDSVKTALKKQGSKKRWESLSLSFVDPKMNGKDILEICSYLPLLRKWEVRSTITINGATEWKRICPRLESVNCNGELSKKVEKVLQGLGVTVKR
jgi:hypothetical protein